jgi:hypothetical protein
VTISPDEYVLAAINIYLVSEVVWFGCVTVSEVVWPQFDYATCHLVPARRARRGYGRVIHEMHGLHVITV